MKVEWSREAELDRAAILAFIAERATEAIGRVDALFDAAAQRLETFPLMGREGELAGTRECFPHPRYRLVYEVSDDTVFILALVHTSRQWPPNKP